MVMKMNSDPVEYAQDIFEDAFNEARKSKKPVLIESIIRRIWAYGLKGIAVFSGIAIASGVDEFISHILGIAVAVSVAIDFLFSNHERMGATTKASQAYNRLIKEVRRTHQVELTPILIQKTKNSERAKTDLIELLGSLTSQIHTQCEMIEQALDEINLKALDSLSIERERQ